MPSVSSHCRDSRRPEKCAGWLKVKKRSLEVQKSLKWVNNSLNAFCRELATIEEHLAMQVCPGLDPMSLTTMEFSKGMHQLFNCLRSTPLERAISNPFKLMNHLLSEVLGEPLLLLMRLIEFGYYIYEIENVMEEALLPTNYGELATSILEHLKVPEKVLWHLSFKRLISLSWAGLAQSRMA